MPTYGPNPDSRFPIPGITRTGFLKPFVNQPNIIIGDFTYYDDPKGPEHFLNNILYHFEFIGDRLIIGKFCSIAAETRFIMNGGNHPTNWLTTYPFPIFGQGWEAAMPEKWPHRGDTVIGNDVWIGYGAIIMPGVSIGNGAIVAAGSVVTRDIAPYAIVGGNPAQVIRSRFARADIGRLERIAWWNWDLEKITRHVQAICSSDISALERAA